MSSPHLLGTIISTAKNKTKDEGRKMYQREHLTVGRNTVVHVAYGNLPRCDTGTGARGGSSRKTSAPVTCKRCLKIDHNANTVL